MRKNISFFIPSFEGGGAEKILIKLANKLSERGWNVEIVLINVIGPYRDFVNGEINIYDLNSNLHPYLKIFSLFKYLFYLYKNRPSLVLAALHSSNLIAVLGKILGPFKTKVIITVHSPLSQEYYASKTKIRKLFRWLMKVAMKIVYPLADRIIVVSNGIRIDLVDWLKIKSDNLIVIDAYPVLDAEFKEKLKQEVSHPWLLNKEFPIILAIGRLTQQKDFDTLLIAFNKFLKKYKDAKLIILGEGKERSRLENNIRELSIDSSIQMPGFVNNPYIFLKNADLFVLSSRWEALPTVLMEALGCGTQIVATDCPYGPREILNNGKYGFLVQVGNDEQLAEKMSYAIKNPMDKSLLLERAKYYSAARVAQIYENVIHEVLNE